MKIDVILPHIDKQELLDKCLSFYKENCNPEITNVIVIDNGSTVPLKNEIYGSVVRVEDNLGMIQSLVFAKKISKADILIYSHSDMFYYDKDWDKKVVKAFTDDEKLGLLGTVGGSIAMTDGGRGDMYCSFTDFYNHGAKTPEKIPYVALLDGCSMMFRRTALDSFEIDETFYPHHFYDKDWSLEVLTHGWKVGVIDVSCAHLSTGVTSGIGYSNWADNYLAKRGIEMETSGNHYFYLENEKKYLKKWMPLLPIYVQKDGSYISAQSQKQD